MKNIKLYPSGKIIPCEDGETILSALERNGLMLPNNCRAGACGECKIKVRSGKYDQGFILNMALSSKEKEEGYGLMCVAKALDDEIELEWGDVDLKPKLFDIEKNKLFCVVDKREITQNVVKLELRALGKLLRFWPGQYIKLTDENKSVKEAKYSISNTPNPLGIIEIYVEKTLDGENNNWVHKILQEGDSVFISGAYGDFIGNASIDKPVLCLGEGVGIAPIMSLAQGAMIRGGFKKNATVIEISESDENILAQGPLLFLDKKFRNFNYKKCINQSLKDFLNELKINDLSQYTIYLSGRKKFIKRTLEFLNKNGAQKDSTFIENFNY